jgi:dipeptidyl aminopeptidase/acylaminoacyl peptidase
MLMFKSDCMMKGLIKPHVLFLLLFVAWQNPTLFAQAPAKPTPVETVQPVGSLPDRDLFINNPEIRNGQISPDGKMISFFKSYKGVTNIWIKKTDEPIARAHPVTSSEEALDNAYWTADSRFILFAHHLSNNPNSNIYAVDLLDSSGGDIPIVRNLTPMDSAGAMIIGVSKKNPDIVWIGLNRRDPRAYDLYKLEISTGAMTIIRKNSEHLEKWYFDWEENLRLATRINNKEGSTEVMRLNKDGSATKIYDCSALEKCRPLCFDSISQNFFMVTNKGDNQDLQKLVSMNVETLRITDVEQDPRGKVDFGEIQFGSSSHEILFTSYIDVKPRKYWKDTSYQADHALLQKKIPGREIDFMNSSDDENRWLVMAWSDDKLAQVYLFDRSNKQLTLQYTPENSLKPYEAVFSKMQPAVYQSSDEMNIPGYLSLPKGLPAKNLPLIVMPHAGPWDRDYWGFNRIVQWLTSRGYAVLQMNYRGSAGYGKKFMNAGNKQWGLLMQDDITWGVNDLIGKGIADPKRIGIIGTDYGGYAVLAGLTFTSDIYAAGVDINGPANLLSLSRSLPAEWNISQKAFAERVGDSSTVAGKNFLRKRSPLNADTLIKTPLMIVQAQDAPFTQKPDNDRIVVTLRDSSRSVEYISVGGESFPSDAMTDNLAAFAKMEQFLGKNLHGRYQESMKPAVAARLREITVDPAGVTLGVGMTVIAIQELPTPASDLSAGNYSYSLLVEVPGRKVPLAMLRSISTDSTDWIVTDRILGQSGDQSDEARYQRGNLQLISRKTLQKSTVTDYHFGPREVTTTTGDKTTTELVDGAYLHDGAGIDLIIARMPLKEGYVTGFYLVGEDGKPKLYQLRVTGRDTVNSEPCLKVELVNAENTAISTRMWISTKQKMAYRTIVPLASFAGAKMTIELRQQPTLPKFLLFLWMITPGHGL